MPNSAQASDGVISLAAADTDVRLMLEGSLVNPAVARFTIVAANGTETDIKTPAGGTTWVSTNQTGPVAIPLNLTPAQLDGAQVDVTLLLKFYWKSYKGPEWKSWLSVVATRGGKKRQIDSEEFRFKREDIDSDVLTVTIPFEVA